MSERGDHVALVQRLCQLVGEGRVDTAQRYRATGRDLTVADERQWALAAINAEIVKRQQDAYHDSALSALTESESQWVIREVMDRAFMGGRLVRIYNDHPDALNLIVSGAGPTRLEFPDGTIEAGPPAADSDEGLYNEIKGLASHTGIKEVQWDPTRPELELILPDGSRLTAQRWTTTETFVTIRRPTMGTASLESLIGYGTISARLASFLAAAPRADLRILISGSMNAGKTVLLRAMAASLPKDAHVVTVESERELRLHEAADVYPKWVTALEERKPNAEGEGEITMSTLITSIQRMSPDYVLVGEVRGQGSEAEAFLRALQQGYPLTGTIHANGSLEAVTNLAQYYEEAAGASYETALRRAATFIDLAVHVRKLPNGRRVVNSVRLILDYQDGIVRSEELWAPRPLRAAEMASFTSVPPAITDRLIAAGFDPDLSDQIPRDMRMIS